MAKLNHNKLKKYVAEYSELYSTSVEEAQAKMAEDGLTEEQIFEVSEAIENPKEDEAPKETKVKTSNTEPKEETFEEFTTETIYKFKEDSRGNRMAVKNEWGEHEFEIAKVKFIREVKITQAQANILNEQTINSNKGYYLKD